MAAPTFTNLTSGNDVTDRSTYTTASVSPTANRLILVSVTAFDNVAVQPPLPAVTGNGITYDVIHATNGNAIVDSSGADRANVYVFRGMSASPSSGTISIAFSGLTSDGLLNALSWSVDMSDASVETSGTNGSGAIGNTTKQDDDGSGTSATANITINSGNGGFAACASQAGAGITQRASWTELSDVGAGSTFLETQYIAATDTAVSATHASARSGIIGAEIVALAAATGKAGNYRRYPSRGLTMR